MQGLVGGACRGWVGLALPQTAAGGDLWLEKGSTLCSPSFLFFPTPLQTGRASHSPASWERNFFFEVSRRSLLMPLSRWAGGVGGAPGRLLCIASGTA